MEDFGHLLCSVEKGFGHQLCSVREYLVIAVLSSEGFCSSAVLRGFWSSAVLSKGGFGHQLCSVVEGFSHHLCSVREGFGQY